MRSRIPTDQPRRTSAWSDFAHERALVTTSGHLTEPLWAESGAVAISAGE